MKQYISNLKYVFKVFKDSCGYLSYVKVLLEIIIILRVFIDVYLVSSVIESITNIIENNLDILNIFNKEIIILCSASILLTIIAGVSQVIDDVCSEKMQRYLRLRTIIKVSGLDIENFDNPKFYDQINQSIINSRNMDNLISDTVSLLSLFICTIVLCVMGISFNIWLTISIFIFSIPVYVVEKKYYKIIYSWEQLELPVEREIGYITNILTSKSFAKELRFFNINQDYVDRYIEKNNQYITEKTKVLKKKGIPMSIISIVNSLLLIAIYIITGIIVINKFEGSIAVYYYYSSILIKLYSYTRRLYSFGGRFYGYSDRIKRFKNFLSIENKISQEGIQIVGKINNITFKNVYFKYPGSTEYTLKNVNFSVNSNEKILLVGENGAGKSTIIKLLLKFYKPDDGIIMINGIDINEINTISLRQEIGIIFQDYCIYSDSYAYNIALNKLYDEELLNKITKDINFSKKVNSWEGKYRTHITRYFDANGEELSGGEKQKVAIGRCLYKDSSFLVMDEPSSSLDVKTETEFYDIILKEKKKMVLLISHKFSKVTDFDKILYIENGTIENIGSHDEIYKSCENYRKLYDLQLEKYMKENK